MEPWIWAGIALCLIHSGMFSGLNLALLGLSRLQLEVESKSGNASAVRILALREDSHFLLTTVLWGNVAVNCLLTLLSDSVMFGVGAFMFSTVGITIVGEILPQAYFSRNALRVGARLVPFVRLWQMILYPVARPSARLLDHWLGSEEVSYFRERELREVIRQHMLSPDADLERREGLGALNFLILDDLPIVEEGEPVDPLSIVTLPVAVDLPVFPDLAGGPENAFLQKIQASGRKWVVIVDTTGTPRLVLDADALLRESLFGAEPPDPYHFCHRPVVIDDPGTQLGSVIRRLRVDAKSAEDDVIDHDTILFWGESRRIITGADLLGRLMRGVVGRSTSKGADQAQLAVRG